MHCGKSIHALEGHVHNNALCPHINTDVTKSTENMDVDMCKWEILRYFCISFLDDSQRN